MKPKRTPEEQREFDARVERLAGLRDQEAREIARTGVGDCRVLDINGKPVRVKHKSIFETAQEHGIPLPEWFEETRPAPKK